GYLELWPPARAFEVIFRWICNDLRTGGSRPRAACRGPMLERQQQGWVRPFDRRGAVAVTDRGCAETSNSCDHAAAARSETFGVAAAALCATAGVDGFDRGYFESCFADALGCAFCGVYFAGRKGLRPASLASAARCPRSASHV